MTIKDAQPQNMKFWWKWEKVKFLVEDEHYQLSTPTLHVAHFYWLLLLLLLLWLYYAICMCANMYICIYIYAVLHYIYADGIHDTPRTLYVKWQALIGCDTLASLIRWVPFPLEAFRGDVIPLPWGHVPHRCRCGMESSYLSLIPCAIFISSAIFICASYFMRHIFIFLVCLHLNPGV